MLIGATTRPTNKRCIVSAAPTVRAPDRWDDAYAYMDTDTDTDADTAGEG